MDATWTTVILVIRELESLGLVKMTKQGRSNIIDLTTSGKELVKIHQNVLVPLRELQDKIVKNSGDIDGKDAR